MVLIKTFFSAMSMDTNDEHLVNIEDFDKLPLTKNLSDALQINFALIVCVMVPYFGSAFDWLGISSQNGIDWVRAYSRKLITTRSEATTGRKTDFVNLMLENELTEEEAKIATKVTFIILHDL